MLSEAATWVEVTGLGSASFPPVIHWNFRHQRADLPPSFSLLQTAFTQTTLSGVASYTDPLFAMFLLQMPPAFLRDTHVEQTPDQGSRVPTGPHLLALQEEGARLPRSRGGRPAVRARVKLPDIPEPNATKASWEVSAFLEGGNGLLDLLFVSRRSGQKVRRPGLSPGPTARLLCHCGWAAVPF